VFTVRALASLGCMAEADGFRRFIQRSSAGSAEQLQVLFGVDGKRRLTEIGLTHLEGWRGSSPVRIGNAADKQYQADMYGLLLELAGRWSARGNVPDPQDWDFLAEMVNAAVEKWPLPDHGIWEVRDEPRHFVHSKVMCWTAVHRGIALAQQHGFKAPLERWQRAREEIRDAVQTQGFDAERGIFVGSFGATNRLTINLGFRYEFEGGMTERYNRNIRGFDFVSYDDPRMVRTAQAIAHELDDGGLVLRYRMPDGLRGAEGSFVPCTFWLAECLARQGRMAEAKERFDRACRCANDLGLFSEQYSASSEELLGNFPQGLTHLAHISAALALEGVAVHDGPAN